MDYSKELFDVAQPIMLKRRMLQAHGIEIAPVKKVDARGVTLVVSEDKRKIQELANEMSLMAKNFSRTLKKIEKRSNKTFVKGQRSERDRSVCHGYGQIKADCPNFKKKEQLKCLECNGIGHTKTECISSSFKKDKSYIVKSKSKSSDDVDIDVHCEFRTLYDNWLFLGKERVSLMKERLTLHEMNKKLKEELSGEVEKNRELIQLRLVNEKLKKELTREEEKNRELIHELADTRKKIHMLNNDTKDLEIILASGRVGKSNFGLGYNGGETSGKTSFVKGESESSYRVQSLQRNNTRLVPARRQNNVFRTVSGYECHYCGREGHIKKNCYRYVDCVNKLLRHGRFYPHQRRGSQVYVAKSELYCQIAYTSVDLMTTKPRYFDIGASRHMTFCQENLNNYTDIKESKVTFGGGAKSKIRGKVDLTKGENPMNFSI